MFYKEIKVICLFSQENYLCYLLYNVLSTTIYIVCNTLLCTVLYSVQCTILFKNIKVPCRTSLFIEEFFSSCLCAVLNTILLNVLNTALCTVKYVLNLQNSLLYIIHYNVHDIGSSFSLK